MSRIDTRWVYPLTEATENKSRARPGVGPRETCELIGVDGSKPGGATLAPGFYRVVEMAGDITEGPAKELFPFAIRRGDTNYIYGYLVRFAMNNQAWFRMVYKRHDNAGWEEYIFVEPVPGRFGTSLDTVDMRVVGERAWVGVEGQEPFYFYWNEDATPDPAIEVQYNTDLGPNIPAFLNDDIVSVPDGGTPSTGYAANTEFVAHGATTGDPGMVRFFKVLFEALPGESDTADVMNGPSQSGVAADPEGLFVDRPPGQDDPVKAVGSIQITGGVQGMLTPVTANTDPISEIPTSVSCMVQFYDTRTGTRSNISQPIALNWDDTSNNWRWIAAEIVYDHTRWDTAYIYRTVSRAISTYGEVGGNQFHLDRIITLADYETQDQTGTGGAEFTRAFYFYEIPDNILVLQETFQTDVYYDPEMPTAGALELYEGTMLFGNTGRLDSTRGGLGVLRWSNTYDVSPQQISPFNIYPLQNPSEEIIRFVKVGPNVIGFTRASSYLIRKENIYVKAYHMHLGFGLVTPTAACEMGSLVYYLTAKGIKSLDATGALDDLNVLDDLVRSRWKLDLASISMAYDAEMSAVFIHNARAFETAILWMNEGYVTEMRDTTFFAVKEGLVPDPGSPDEDNPEWTPRAIWGQDIRTSVDDRVIRFMVWDHWGQKDPGHRMMPHTLAQTRYLVKANFDAGSVLTLYSGDFSDDKGIEGCYLYVLDAEDETLIGKKAEILYGNTGEELTLGAGASGLYGLKENDKVCISPVLFRWVGSPLALVAEDGTQFSSSANYFTPRTLDSIACAFTNVSGALLEDEPQDGYFRGLIFSGSDEDAHAVAYVVHPNDGLHRSLADGASVVPAAFGKAPTLEGKPGVRGTCICPAVEVYVTDVTFTLLAVAVGGKIEGGSRLGKATSEA